MTVPVLAIATTADVLLELSGVRLAYGGIQAVKGIDLVVRQGELVCLIGANGAGRPRARCRAASSRCSRWAAR